MSLKDNIKSLPIGIFDSGVGGLTVLRALRETLPHESFLYLGDTARLPYGTKSPETVKEYALNANTALLEQGVKLLVVACNTASAVALTTLQQTFAPVPVIGVIESGAQACLVLPEDKPIIVMATESTVKWHAYQKALQVLAPQRTIFEWPCSLLVSLAEEGWCQGELVERIVEQLLQPLREELNQQPLAGVLLGCTHFPVLKQAIQNVFTKSVPVIDPALSVAKNVKQLLVQYDMLNTSASFGEARFLATDNIERFIKVAQVFLKHQISTEDIGLVNIAVPSQAIFLTTQAQQSKAG